MAAPPPGPSLISSLSPEVHASYFVALSNFLFGESLCATPQSLLFRQREAVKTMHGVKRDRSSQTAEARAARKAKEASRLQAYLEVQSRFFELKSRKEHSQDSLAATTKILTLSPELYTAWNFRRDVLKELFKGETVPIKEEKKDFFASVRIEEDLSAASASKRNDGKEERGSSLNYKRSLLEDDLELTTHALRAHPKVYWIWNHRRWCLEEYPDETGTKWKRELAMVDKMLEMDPRNCESAPLRWRRRGWTSF